MTDDNLSVVSNSESESDSDELTQDMYCGGPIKTIGSWSVLPRPDLIVPEAFVDDILRIPRQIAVATDERLEVVLQRFDEIFNGPGWRELPNITVRDILQYASDSRVSAYMYVGNHLEHVDQRDNHKKRAVVFVYWCGCVYFYKDMGTIARDEAQKRYARELLNTNANLSNDSAKDATDARVYRQPCKKKYVLEKSRKHPPKPVEEFQPFPWHLALADVPGGLYWVPSQVSDECPSMMDMVGVLGRFLKSSRFPKVSKLDYSGSGSRTGMLEGHKPFELT